jgi:Protein of unknown function (DUF2877)
VAARALYAAPGALRVLRRGGRGAVELVLRRGAYVRLGEEWLLLTEPGAPFGPLTLAVTGLEPGTLHPAQPVRLLRERLVIGGQGVSLERLRERRPPAGSPTAAPGTGRPTAAPATGGSAPAPLGGAPPAGLAPGLRALGRGRLVEGVRLLAGRGDGLTPAGDDALAGYAAWRHAAGRPVAISAIAEGRSSPLGLAYLRCAERGELPGAGVELLTALCAGSPRSATAAALALREWGASSGTALTWGILTGAREEGVELQASPRRTERNGPGAGGRCRKRTAPASLPRRVSW